MNKKFTIIFIAILVLLAAGAGAIIYFRSAMIVNQPTPTPSASDETVGWKTYFQDRVFILKYPSDFKVQAGETSSGGANLDEPLVKISYPEGFFASSKTNFAEAYLVASRSRQQKFIDACGNFSDIGNMPGPAGDKIINGLYFKAQTTVGAAAGNIYDSRLYRILRQGICYEIALVVHTGNIGNYPAGTVRKFDKSAAFSGLEKILATFRFNTDVVCSDEAKICPDGSSVGRQAPDCSFAPCPAVSASPSPIAPPGGSGSSGIRGTVTTGPTCPVERIPPDPNCADKPYQTLVVVFRASDLVHAVAQTRSDANGKFSLILPAGDYILGAGESNLPRCGHPAVTVKSGLFATADIFCDTGIR